VNGWGLVTADYFSPTNNAALNQGDVDLGSGGPTLLPASAGGTSSHPNLLLGGGKQGILYLVDRDHMGGFGASNNVVQEFDNAVNETFCVPAYFNGRIYTTSAYGSTSGVANSGTLISWPLTNASITTGSPIYSSDQYLFPGCSPWISSNGTSNGVVWAIGMGQLRAYSAATMSELWTSASAPLGSTVKFTTPTPVNGHVYVGTADHLVAYGLISTATAPPNPPTLLTAAATGASTIALNWTDNFNDESGFRIERSADGTNYTEIASVGVNQTTYNDSGLSSQATYYYRVRAYNLYNTISYSTYIYANATTASIGSVLPVYLYHFDEGAGTATIDSASGNNGTLIGSPPPSWVSPGRVGSSNLTFSGTGASNQTGQSAVQVTNNLAPVLGQTSSLLFWIKTNQKGNSAHNLDPAITGAETVGSSNDIDWGYIDGSGHIGVSVGSGSGTSVISQNSISDGQWHHIALTRDSSAGTVQVYVDGVLSTTGTLPTGSISSPFSLIGGLTQLASDGSTFTGANYLNAQLDDVQVYNQVVDASVVASIALAPFAPTNLTVAVAPGAELDLSWTDNANNETAYEVFRSTNGGPFVQISQLAANTVFYADTDVTSGASYSYYVTAVNSAGANNSNTAPPTLAGAPSTPTNAMVAYLSPTEIDLTWTDNSTNETGFRVLRAGSDGNFVTVASLPANTTSFRDTTVTPGTTYGYHIEAYNAAGYFDFTGIEDITTPTQSPYATWFAAYPSITDTTPTDDPNNIGAPNLLAYAFNLDPTKSAVTGLPVVTAQNGYLTISFVERNLPTDLIYTVQVSSDLVTWNSGSTYTTPVSTTAIDSATQRVVVRDNIPISSGSTRFIRVNVSH
jgi:fibronectin type 3 domain-containing protein